MVREWRYSTTAGVWRVVERVDRYDARLDDEDLGRHHSAVGAMRQLCAWQMFILASGAELGFGLPEELSEWTFFERADR